MAYRQYENEIPPFINLNSKAYKEECDKEILKIW